MKIAKLSLTNWKGLNVSDELAPITIYHGPNWTGKSARLEAIRCVLLGYDPALGKRGMDVFQYASAEVCGVDLLFDNRQVVKREWRRVKGAVTVKVECDNPLGNVPPVLLDSSVYFGLSERERIKMVFDACRIKSDVLQELENRLDRIPVTEQQRPRLLQLKVALQETKLRDQSSLERFIERWMDWRKESDHQVRGATLAAGYVSANSEVPNVDTEQATLDRCHGEAEKLIVDITQIRNAMMQVKDLAAKRVEAEQLLAKGTGCDKRLFELHAHIGKLNKVTRPSEARMEELARAISAATVERQYELKSLETRRKRRTELQNELETVLGESFCPTCGATDGVWKKRYRTKVRGQLDEIASQESSIEGKIDSLQRRLEQWSFEKSKLGISAKQYGEAQVLLAEACLERHRLLEYQEQRAELERIVKAPLPAEDLEAKLLDAQRRLGEVRAMEQTARDKIAAAIAARGQAAMRMQALGKLDSARADHDLAKRALAEAQAVKEKLVSDTFGKLLSVANGIAAPILERPLCYCENEIGYWATDKDGVNPTRRHWISFKTFSGSEQAIAFAAISLALAQDSPIKLVLLDECGRLEPKRKVQFLRLLQKLIASGTIDQAILCDVSDEDWRAESAAQVQFIQTGRTACE